MWSEATIISIEKETNLTWRFIIESNDDFDFKAGQFVTIKINDLKRSYSIASYKLSNKIFELLIVKLDGGQMTNILFNDIKVGDKIEIRGPLGRFNLPDNVENDLVLICTGTGLAPFRSILQSIVLNNISHRKIYLIFGTRTYQDLLCFDEMKEYENKLKNFKYIPVLSREDWEGESGYVHNQYIDLIKSKKLKDPIFYLCGWRDMIKEARNNLKELGFDSKKIKLEIYG